MFNSFIIYGAILAATMLQALPVAAVPTTALAKSPIPGYRVEAMTWEIQTTPGGPTVNVTGTIEQVIQFAEKQNPDFRSDFGLGDDTPIDLKSTPSLGGFVKGFYDLVYLVECFRVNTKSANLGTFEEVIEDLHNQPRENEATLGPGVCTQFGCKEKTVVWWCNEVSGQSLPELAFASIPFDV
ncbi:hypothetical protein SMACR_08242 [Sordaria macrospora]|uniref:WGS project CABT00000000 data, contig 2.43 n=2 Tax=Sordaria macrospora TaxID=5147 RepID=F7W892_SORMK|nr:uncharacterized protein SMAC_08242 [Sordaria macrospora k-hell]KAA8631798.1 hypothetical protein SMACR_08242 [Sordaria macrospora]KAH7632433.1 hypothetical protein B0T09DRAFT_257373 [Sordaria sp. MPI-SDFR-AT-0083]WPJ61073.1 hypothetical protein SMAC4_08242 [Sordaria macrospora]CCC13737.1 unnamed protein product [Sordaria macrospora k-hell]